MTESLKFGPEWLRNTVAPALDAANLSSSSSNAASRYPLAEFRYGREEMLSLFDKNIKLPDIYSKYKKLFVDKIQCPLALTPSTDEEIEYSRNIWPTRSVGAPGSTGRGRGISAERGRGRGRGLYHPSYQRSTSLYDEEGRSIGRGERPWLERNGTGELGVGEYGATTSPRKEYGRVGAENWRRSRTDEDGTVTVSGSDWRSSGFTTRDTKWGAGRSWRDDWEGGPGKEEYQRSTSNPNGSNGTERSGPKPYANAGGLVKKRSWGEGDDSLPEWATEDPSDYGGSFDATGAFHDSEDDDLHRSHHAQQHQRSPPNPKQPNAMDQNRSEKPTIRSDIKAKVEAIVAPDRSSEERDSYLVERRKEEEHRKTDANKSNEGSLEKETSPGSNKVPNNIDAKRGKEVHVTPENTNSQNSVPQTTELRRVAGTGRVQNISESSVDRMQEVADDMVAQLMMEDELINAFDNDLALNKSGASPLLGNIANNRSSSSQQQQQQPQPPSRPTPGTSTDFWFYQDPQNKVQGPFSAAEMAEWYRAGYFDETLFVRRGCDSRFSTLGDLIKICAGAIPFISSHLIPAMVTPELPPLQNPLLSVLGNSAGAAAGSAPQILETDVQLKYQLHVLQKQFMMRQQQLILQKLMATEPWNMLSTEQQNTMLNHHMAQVTLPENLSSTASLVGLNPAQLQQLHQQTLQGSLFGSGGPGMPPTQKDHQQVGAQHQSNSHNVPSNIIQQMNQQNNSSPVQPVSQANHQQQRRANGQAQMQQNPDQIRQLIHSMSLGHLQQQQVNSSVPQPQPKISPIEADPIKSLIMQLSMQKNNNSGVPVTTMQPGVGHPLAKPMHAGSGADSVFPWGMLPGTGAQVNPAGMQHLMQQQNNNSQFHHPNMRNMPGFNLMENDLDLRKNEQQQPQWNTPNSAANPNNNKPSSLLSMWEMPPIKTPVINNGDIGGMQINSFAESKTEQELEKQRHFLMEEQRHMQQQQQHQQQPLVIGQQNLEKDSANNFHPNAESKLQNDDEGFEEVKNERESKETKEARRQAKQKEQEEAAKNKHNNNKKAEANNAKTQLQQQQSTKAKSAQKEADEKKRKAEDKKKSKELKELKERQQIEEKRKQEEMMEQQRKSKLLEAQRRETAMKIQEEQLALQQQRAALKTQQQNQQRPVTQMAPWSNSLASGPTGPSLMEIEKAERQHRAEQLRIEQAMREQREQQHLFEMQQKQESILKWNAQNIMPAAVKSLAEIQAEEHAKQTAVEKELAAQNAAKQREEEKKGVQNMASFWSTTAQQSAWNTGKIWGSGASSNYSTSGGGFWEEPTKVATNQKMPTSTKMLAKSQTMGSITTNKGQNAAQKQQQQQELQQQSKMSKQVAANMSGAKPLTPNNKPAGPKPTKSDKKNDDSFSAEFNNWCCKALNNLNAEVDVPTFVGFLHDIESPFEIKDYIKMYLGETKECIEFSKQFLERRSKLKNQQRAQNAHIDDMCSPAPALTPNDFQEVKNKTKKVKKGKMTKVDNRMLGFSVTASPHWNLEKNMESS